LVFFLFFFVFVVGSVVVMQGADALVNAANRLLHDEGGIASAFVQCGGDVIQQESDALIARNGPLDTSQTAVTTAGCLDARDLINAVGPIYSSGPEDIVKHQLRDTMFNVIRTARLLCDDHVAVPLISAGIYGFGNQLSAEILLQAAFDFYLYWYETAQYGEFSAADIAHARNTTRFPAARNCTAKLVPSKITFVGFYQDPSDLMVLNAKMDQLDAELARLRMTFGNGTFTSSTNSWTAPPTTTPSPTPVTTPTTPHPSPTGTPTPTPDVCLGMPCWALGLIIALVIIVICFILGYFIAQQMKRRRAAYSQL
jgi:O-acetyl-ADP-ribose deacetylase (regulator of RNase III)